MALHAEMDQAQSCTNLLQRIQKIQSELCPGIHDQTVKRLDVPRVSKALEPKSECDDATPHVSLRVANNIVICVWKWGHFDFGVDFEDTYDREHGFHMKPICNKFIVDCQVNMGIKSINTLFSVYDHVYSKAQKQKKTKKTTKKPRNSSPVTP